MYNDGQSHRVLDGGDEVVGLLGGENTRHVLDANGAYAHLRHLLAHLNVLVERVNGACGVGDGAGGLSAGLHGLLYRDLEVVNIVERVENTDDINAVFYRAAHEAAHHVVAVMLVAEDVLSAQQHLELGIGHMRLYLAQSLPRVLVEKAQAHVEGCAAPALYGVEAGLVHRLKYGFKFVV